MYVFVEFSKFYPQYQERVHPSVDSLIIKQNVLGSDVFPIPNGDMIWFNSKLILFANCEGNLSCPRSTNIDFVGPLQSFQASDI